MRKFIVLVSLLVITQMAMANASGPPPQLASEPPNYGNCTQCHNYNITTINDSLALNLSGVPVDGYELGTTYELTLILNRSGSERWGFELTAVYETAPDQWATAGSFATVDPNTQLDNSITDFQYIKQTQAGTWGGTPNSVTWYFEWTAPDQDLGMVYFYYTGNAANNDNLAVFPSRDYIYAWNFGIDMLTPPPEPPVVSGIPDQTIYLGQSFSEIHLDDYVTDPDTPVEDLTWEATGNVELIVDIDPLTRIATVTMPGPDWFESETITFTATDPEGGWDSDDATFTSVNEAPIIVSLPDIEGAPGETILIPVFTTEILESDSAYGIQTLITWDASYGVVDTVFRGPLIPEIYIYTWNLSVPGQANGGWWYWLAPYITGEGVLCYLIFTVDQAAQVGDITPLTFESFSLTLSSSPILTVDGSLNIVAVEVKQRDGEIPTSFELEQNYPNPFNPETSISFNIARDCHVTLDVYDVSGRLVAQLVDGELSAGSYSETFSGAGLSSGIYFYHLSAGDYSMTRKMALLR